MEFLKDSETLRSLEKHAFSEKRLGQYPRYVYYILLVKKAAALANEKAKQIPQDSAAEICKAIDGLIRENSYERYFVADVLQGGGSIAVHRNILEVLCYFSKRPIEEINASQSTADVCATAIRLALFDLGQGLKEELKSLCAAFFEKSKAFEKIPWIARTCFRDASWTHLGSLFEGYAHLIQRREKNFSERLDELLQVNLGGTVFGSSEGASSEYRNSILDSLRSVVPYPVQRRASLFDAAQNIDDLGSLGAELDLLCHSLIKICQDLRVLFSGPQYGFQEIHIPQLIRGSSFYGNKNNPTLVETVLQACFQVIGQCHVVQSAMDHAELNLNVFDGAAGINLYESTQMLSQVLNKFRRHCVNGIEAIGTKI